MIEKLARRGFLGFVLGGAAAASAPPVIGVKAAAAALGVNEAMTATEIAEAGAPSGGLEDAEWRLINRIEQLHYNRRVSEDRLPVHIATKRSWSPAYKAMIYAREQAIMETYLDRMRRDRSFLDKVKQHFFGGADDRA